MDAVTPVRDFPDTTWASDGPTRGVEPVVESGAVLRFPHLRFALMESELRFLDPRWADGKAKNISLRWSGPPPSAEMRGAAGRPAELAALQAMIARYAEFSEAFALRLFPHYRGHLRRGNTSFRPAGLTLQNTRSSRVSSLRQLVERPATSTGRNEVLPRCRWPR